MINWRIVCEECVIEMANRIPNEKRVSIIIMIQVCNIECELESLSNHENSIAFLWLFIDSFDSQFYLFCRHTFVLTFFDKPMYLYMFDCSIWICVVSLSLSNIDTKSDRTSRANLLNAEWFVRVRVCGGTLLIILFY